MSLGFFIHPCQGDLVVKSEINDVPYFNAPIFIENKMCVGKIDEIFGSLHDFYVSVKLNDCISVASFKIKQKVIITLLYFLCIKKKAYLTYMFIVNKVKKISSFYSLFVKTFHK